MEHENATPPLKTVTRENVEAEAVRTRIAVEAWGKAVTKTLVQCSAIIVIGNTFFCLVLVLLIRAQ